MSNLARTPLDPPPPSAWLVAFLRRLGIDLQQQQQQRTFAAWTALRQSLPLHKTEAAVVRQLWGFYREVL